MFVDAHQLFDLTGKTALVTGANGGLGRSIAHVLASAGASIIATDRDLEATNAAVNKLGANGYQATSQACDFSDLDAVAHFCETLITDGQVPDVCVLNAGIQGPAGPIGNVSSEDWNRVLTVNLASVHRIAAKLAPAMAHRGSGSFIFMSSIAGLRGNNAIGLYGLTKAALSQLARNLAVEWGPRGLRFNAIAPGLIRTLLAETLLNDEPFMTRRLAATPLRRVGEPHEVAGVVLMLASAAGGFITGQTIVVDGGTLISDGS